MAPDARVPVQSNPSPDFWDPAQVVNRTSYPSANHLHLFIKSTCVAFPVWVIKFWLCRFTVTYIVSKMLSTEYFSWLAPLIVTNCSLAYCQFLDFVIWILILVRFCSVTVCLTNCLFMTRSFWILFWLWLIHGHGTLYMDPRLIRYTWLFCLG